ncbi:MAG: diadenylate cyclase CdaA [Bacteroides sp.]|nr:diadenylate cyclase CdaA [Ruminococcus flavefaciens]MCM1554469.1 diadenylate cyclase CdaA [Bacteroides sp.]
METITQWFMNLDFIQIIDLTIVGFLVYQFYKIVKGTSALNVVLSIIGIYIFWKIAQQFELSLTTEILDRVISMGFLALVIVFQPEIRRALFMLSTPGAIEQRRKWWLFGKINTRRIRRRELSITPIVQACMHMSQEKTGALIILTQLNRLPGTVATGEKVDALISSALIENIFFKNSPLHDGALIIERNKLIAARCILPVTTNKNVSASLGLRHRSAIGITEQSDALAIVVSEETGSISFCLFGNVTYNVSPTQLRAKIEEFFYEHKDEDAPKA